MGFEGITPDPSEVKALDDLIASIDFKKDTSQAEQAQNFETTDGYRVQITKSPNEDLAFIIEITGPSGETTQFAAKESHVYGGQVVREANVRDVDPKNDRAIVSAHQRKLEQMIRNAEIEI